MTHNLFDNAKFGDMFLTTENKQAVFLRFSENAEYKFAILYVEGWGNVQVFRHNGKEIYNDAAHSIISKREEPVKRNPADIEAAMQEVEEKSRVFTEAHKGEDTDTILAQMRGEEPVREGLEEASKEWLRPQLDKSYANYGEAKMMELTHFDGYAMFDAIEFGAKWQKEQIEEALLSEVLPCFMHGGEADEVVAKLDEVLNQKKKTYE